MNGIDLLIQEHKNVSRMLLVIRKVCFKFMETNEIDYEDFDKIINFIRNFADGHHHNKEEIFLFNKMVEHLGQAGKNAITHGMLVEHDLGRLYIKNLIEALENYKNDNKEAKLDIIANAISYATLLENHIHKEDNIIFNFAKRGLSKELLELVDKECMEYEQNYTELIKENMDILTYLEEKYI
ncbi:MAG: hemerythrin domain-containing protein [Romboutsia sp.]|nr:hemerythrin domain-containing protein [Romboutsia sp.]